METTHKSSLTAALALGAVAIAMSLAVVGASPSTAQAGESHYCWGNTVGAKSFCYSGVRWFNAQYGQGQQGSVCVGNGYSGSACSGGPAPQSVYMPVGATINQEAWITNNLWSQNNQVYGITFTP
jgi:hypothetical protein